MANKKNLVPLSTDKAREIGKIGGKKSGQVRAERKKLKEELEILLEEGNTQERMCLALIDKAINGNVKAFEVIRDSIGEKVVNTVELKNSPIIVDDINPYANLTTEELRKLIEENT